MSDETSADSRLLALRELAGIPTAPGHEARVAAYLGQRLAALGLPFRRDRWGNLIARYERDQPGAPARRPLALVAHLDHPALEVLAVEGTEGAEGTGLLLGGVARACFEQPVPVRFFAPGPPPAEPDEGVPGEVVGLEATGATAASESSATLLRLRLPGPVAPGHFGVFDLPAYAAAGDRLHLRAADDLVGCAAILLTLEELARQGAAATVLGVFTRAEEVGLVGATLLAASGLLPREATVVSLETSRELPGALLGLGPVIRVGDRTRTFDAAAEAVLLAARQRLQSERPAALVQRQLMSGGTCEATAFGLAGYRATGLAFPLGNYHNVGPGERIAAEQISGADFLTGVDLLLAAAAVADAELDGAARARLDAAAARHRDRLAATATDFPSPAGEA